MAVLEYPHQFNFSNGRIHLWNVLTQQLIGTLKNKNGKHVYSTWPEVKFSPDGKTLLGVIFTNQNGEPSGEEGEYLINGLWDAQTGAWKAILRQDNGKAVKLTDSGFGVPLGLVSHFTPDSKTVIVSAPGVGVGLWDAATGKALASLDGQPATSLAINPDGRTLVVGGHEDRATLREVRSQFEALLREKSQTKSYQEAVDLLLTALFNPGNLPEVSQILDWH